MYFPAARDHAGPFGVIQVSEAEASTNEDADMHTKRLPTKYPQHTMVGQQNNYVYGVRLRLKE
jgi:hypothetical protein